MIRHLAAALLTLLPLSSVAQEDPYLWLEDVSGEKAIGWVKQESAATRAAMEAHPDYKALRERLLGIYQSRERIPSVQRLGRWYYNLWQDAANPRGVWRRTTLDEYRKAEPAWETVLDVGELGRAEKQAFVFKGAVCLYPGYTRCLVSLSRGGADATELREFDTEKKAFVKDGFVLPESKGNAVWRDADTLYIARDFGAGTLTRSGYPRIVKEWKRGTPLASARVLFEAREADVGAFPTVTHAWDRGRVTRYERIRRATGSREGDEYLLRDGKFVKLDVPMDADVDMGLGMLLVRLRSDWKPGAVQFYAGSLIGAPMDNYLAGRPEFHAIYEPRERASLQAFAVTQTFVVLDILDNVKGRIVEGHRHYGRVALTDIDVPANSSIGVTAVDRVESDDYWMTVTNYVEPTTLHLVSPRRKVREKLKSLPHFFDAKNHVVTQHEATSKDGTKVPYFVVAPKDAKMDGTLPTILYGYGGFEISMTPGYSAAVGTGWLEQGGAWVVANVRGGGELGPQWHQVARRDGRHKTHDDFIAVAEDLIKRNVTSPRHLGIMGGSQGGLLVGSVFTQRPELFRAVVSTVPLLDMKRYHKLHAGASWMSEYGNPDDPKDWEFLAKYSPYQNVHKDRKYPRVLFTTSTRDDRVHPAHARKMYARMKEQGHEVRYFEYTEGGHGSGVIPEQQADTWSIIYTFFRTELR